MKNKPNLGLTEKGLRAGVNNPNRSFSVKFKADLIAVLEYMIENQNSMKIGLTYFEETIDLFEFGKTKEECGTFRCVAGWWAYWLGIPILARSGKFTNRFLEAFADKSFYGFTCNKKFPYRLSIVFFGSKGSATLA